MLGMDTGLSLMRAGFGMYEAGIKFAETMLASQSVIGARVGLMDEAIRRPLDGDYAELNRMIPEKMAAFSHSRAALTQEWRKAQGDMFDQWREFGALMAGVPTIGRINAFTQQSSSRGTRALVRSMEAGGVALAPVHKAATANARRLKKRH